MDKSVCIMRQWVLVSHFHSLHALSLSLSRIQLWAVQATITGSAIHWCVADVCPLQWRVWQHIHTTAPASLCDTHEGQGQDAILLSHQNFRSCWFQWVTCLFLTISILYFTSCFFILAASGTMEKNVLEDFLREARIEASVIVCRVCLHEYASLLAAVCRLFHSWREPQICSIHSQIVSHQAPHDIL